MIDWGLILGRLRPASSYHWLGDGMNDTYASIGEWRDTNTTKPTEAECLAEWDVYLIEKAAQDVETALMVTTQTEAVSKYATLPDWARTMSAKDATDYVNGQIWQGMTTAQINAWIDSNITGTTVAQLRAQTIIALKQTAGAIIAMRDLFLLVSK